MPSVTLSHNSFPFLVRSGSRTPLQWNYGPLYNVLLSTDIVRVSESGISWCVNCELHLNRFFNMMPRRLTEWAAQPEWYPSFACAPVLNALCAVGERVQGFDGIHAVDENTDRMLLFPSSTVRMSSRVLFPESLREKLAPSSACKGLESNRQLVFGVVAYEVSLCDLVHNKFQFVVFPESSRVAWRQHNLSSFWTGCVTLLVLFLFTMLCQYMSILIRRKNREYSRSLMAVILLALLYSFANSVNIDFSIEEQLLNVLLQWYTVIYYCAAMWPSKRTQYEALQDNHLQVQNTNVMGALIALKFLLTAHLQRSYDTPFLTILVLFFGARSFLKFLNFVLKHSLQCSRQHKTWKFFFLCMDTIVFACVLELAVRSSARSKTKYAGSAVGLLWSSALAGTFLHLLIEHAPVFKERQV